MRRLACIIWICCHKPPRVPASGRRGPAAELALALARHPSAGCSPRRLRFAVERGLRAVNFNVLTERAGTDHFLQQGGLQGDTTTLFGLFAYWMVLLAALMQAASEVGLIRLTDLLQRVAALLAEGAGGDAHRGASARISPASWAVRSPLIASRRRFPTRDILGKIARYLIMAFVIMIALSQVEVGGDIVQRTFLIMLGGVVLALALAFGLGGKDWAAAMLERWWPRHGDKDH